MENNGLIRITVEGDTAFVATETVSQNQNTDRAPPIKYGARKTLSQKSG